MAGLVLLTADALTVVQQFINGAQWGVFLNGQQVVGQNVFGLTGVVGSAVGSALSGALGIGQTSQQDLEFEQRFAITTAPQEGGAFLSYNIVQTPYRVIITFNAGGSTANRALLRAQVEAIVGTTNLYTALTPEGPITSLAAVGMAYRRHPEDVGMLSISVIFAQVRPVGNTQFNTTQTPNSATGATAPIAGGGTTPIPSPTPNFASATSSQSYGQLTGATAPSSFTSLVTVPAR